MFEYDPASKAAAEVLNQVDLKDTLDSCYLIGKVMAPEIRYQILDAYPHSTKQLRLLS